MDASPDPLPTPADPTAGPLAGKRIAFLGRLGGLNRRDATQLARRCGAVPVDRPVDAQVVVIGADELPLEDGARLDESTRQAVEQGRCEVITETELWRRVGMLDVESQERQLYTPAMLAELLKVPVATIRRWHRRSLIVPIKEVHRLPYFDFHEITIVRRLATMLAAGISAAAIEKKLDALARYVRGVDRPLAQLSLIVEGRQILLRQQEGLVEPSGQRRFDFETLEQHSALSTEPPCLLPAWNAEPPAVAGSPIPERAEAGNSVDAWLRAAEEHEALGELDAAVEYYRSALAQGGARADVCFQFAELLYRRGESAAARERYYMAIELDDSFVEARANLGCVLAEEGDLELAVAAFQGALTLHPDYADVHYHLARTLSELGRRADSRSHWERFLALAPDSPWAEEARRWLEWPAESLREE